MATHNSQFESAIREAFPEHADMILGIIRGTRDHALTFASAAKRDKQSYHPHDTNTLKLEALNEVIGGHGVESVSAGRGHQSPAFDYVNMGDSYAPTILYLTERHAWRMTTWGDVIERGDYD